MDKKRQALSPATIEEVQEIMRTTSRVKVRGGGSKTALTGAPDGAALLDMSGLAGLLEYEPGEFTFTALAGTPLHIVEAALAEHGQYLPFDPPLSDLGATLGGTVAAGVSGSGRQRYGGVRDFLIGVHFVDGQGRLVRGGGKVVKNAAGFDLPKLMVGSLGQLGALVDLSFKVFPRPEAFATLDVPLPSLAAALDQLARFATARFELEALDMICDDDAPPSLLLRLGGPAAVLTPRLTTLRTWLGGGELVEDEAEAALWRQSRVFGWLADGSSLIKTPLTPDRIASLEEALAGHRASRRYICGGNLAWIGWPGDLEDIDLLLRGLKLGGLVLLGPQPRTFVGVRGDISMVTRIKQVLDPQGKFADQ